MTTEIPGIDPDRTSPQQKKIERRNTALRSSETGRVVPHPRRGDVVGFLKSAVIEVFADPTLTFFPTHRYTGKRYGMATNTILRLMKDATVEVEGKEVSLQTGVSMARGAAEERRIEKRNNELVDWFTAPPEDPEDTLPRTITNAEIVFDLNRTTITEVLTRVDRLDQIKDQTKEIWKKEKTKKSVEIAERKRREKDEKRESERFELEPSEELAWFLGMVTAAGSMLGPRENFTGVSFALGRIIDTDDTDMLAALQSSSERFLGRQGNFRARDGKIGELHLDHSAFAKWLGDFNGGARVDTLREDRFAWLLQPPHIKPYLEGIFDAKGYINKDHRKASIYVLKGTSNSLEQARFYREVLLKFGLESPYLYQRRGQQDTAMGVIVYNKPDLALLANLESKSPKKQRKLDALKTITPWKSNFFRSISI